MGPAKLLCTSAKIFVALQSESYFLDNTNVLSVLC